MRNHHVAVFCLDRLEVQPGDMRFDQIGKKQVGKRRQPPRVCFFLIENKMNDFAQGWISLLVIVLQSLFQLRQRQLKQSGGKLRLRRLVDQFS